MLLGLTYLILVVLLLLVLIAGRGGWRFKLPFVVLVPLLIFGIWHSLASYRGWPSTDQIPKKSIVVSYIIDEPDQERGDPGHIDLWLIAPRTSSDIISYHPGAGDPRAYRIPYSRQLHEQLQKLGGKPGTPLLERVTPGKGKNGKKGTGQTIPKRAYRAYILPPSLPTKGGAK